MRRSGTVAERYSVENTPEHIASFLDSLSVKRPVIGSEATAEYHLSLARACLKRHIPFRLLNPIITKQFTRATVRKRKTDRDDAEIIGRCLLQGAGREYRGEELLPGARILRTTADLRHMAQSLKQKRVRYEEHFPECLAVQEALLKAEQALAESAKVLMGEGAACASKKERELLTSIPGIGKDLSAIIALEVGDASRFPGGKQLVAYAGLDPKVRQSGKILNVNTKITKRGSPYLRRALYLAASIAQRHDPALKAYYLKKRNEGKRYKEATVANARKLTHRVLATLKRGTPYVLAPLST